MAKPNLTPVTLIDEVLAGESQDGAVFATLGSFGAPIRIRMDAHDAGLLGGLLIELSQQAIAQLHEQSNKVVQFPKRRTA